LAREILGNPPRGRERRLGEEEYRRVYPRMAQIGYTLNPCRFVLHLGAVLWEKGNKVIYLKTKRRLVRAPGGSFQGWGKTAFYLTDYFPSSRVKKK
jgi:hypothetical protein